MSRAAQFIKNLERFRLVTFDVTDTLLTFRMPAGDQYAKTASKLGVNIDRSLLEQSFNREFKAMTTLYPNYGSNTPQMDWRKWWTLLVENIFHHVDNRIPQAKLHDISEALIQQYCKSECWTHIEGNGEMLRKVREAGKSIGVISNFDPSLNVVLQEMHMDKQFDFVLTSYSCGVAKPHSKIFKIPLQQYDVSPGEALHIGNLYDVDYVGARNAGWCSLLVTPISADAEKAPVTHVYASLKDMMNALETIDIKW